MRSIVTPLVAVAAAVVFGSASGKTLPTSETSPAFSGHQLARLARIPLAKATSIALGARPGTLTDEELEREKGGSGLRYSFDVASAGVTWEVGVDAKTGAVLENHREGASPD